MLTLLHSWLCPDLKLSTDHMTYKNLALSQTEDPFYTTFVAIRNKTTGKTRLIEANEVVLVPEVTHPRSVLNRFCHTLFYPLIDKRIPDRFCWILDM